MTTLRFAVVLTAALGSALIAMPARAGDLNAGLEVHGTPSMAEIGLPVYPGARLAPKSKDDDDEGGVSLNAWGGAFGLKLQVVKLVSNDSIDSVMGFYRDAMARYGKVMDCGGVSISSGSSDSSDSKSEFKLSCGKGDQGPDKHVLKVGHDEHDFRVVAAHQEGRQVEIDIVHLMIKGD